MLLQSIGRRDTALRGILVMISWLDVRARGYKNFSMLNPAEHEIVNAHKYNNIKKLSLF